MPKTFLAIGECMVEMAPTADGTYSMGFAGDTLNTAWYARKCLPAGWNVGYYTAVGRDQISSDMLAFLNGSGIDTSTVQVLEDRTVGLYMIQLKDGERSFSYWRGEAAARQLACDRDALDRALHGVDLVYFSGITLAILSEADRSVFLEALRAARRSGSRVAFDPNLRPRLWQSIGTMCDCVTAASGLSDIVMPSYEDEMTFFDDKDADATADRYLRAGAKTVVVKNGSESGVCATEGARHSFEPQAVQRLVDTTAAGDSFNAAFLAEFLATGDLVKSADAGAGLAANVIQHRGALVDSFEPA